MMNQIFLTCRRFFLACAALSLICILQLAQATTVKPLNLGEMTTNADKIFRAEVIAIKAGTVTIGGGQLATTSYTLRVKDLIKGELPETGGKQTNVLTLQMIGTPKATSAPKATRFVGGFRTPQLRSGNEYLLFTTRPSTAGLSMTVGVGQGLFSFQDGSLVRNEFDNVGLFRGMADAPAIAAEGAVEYNALVSRIERLLGK